MWIKLYRNSFFQEVKANPNNYDAWFDYLRLVESEGNPDNIRETYERAIANVPPTKVRISSANEYNLNSFHDHSIYQLCFFFVHRRNNFGDDIYICG